MRLDRLLAIVTLLLNRRRLSAPELARRLEVTERTIYRDLEAINLAGIPVVAFPGKGGGFALAENYSLDRQLLSRGDLTMLIAALKGVNRALTDRQLEGAIEKLTSLAPVAERSQLLATPERVVIDVLPWGQRRPDQETLSLLHDAIVHRLPIVFNYVDSGRRASRRTVEPVTLVFKGYGWYLFAWCRRRHATRLFRVSRMRQVRTAGAPFPPRNERYVAETVQAGKGLRVQVRFPANWRRHLEDYYAPDEITELPDGRIEISPEFPGEDAWLYRTLLGWGDEAEVVAPAAVRQRLSRLAALIAARHVEP